jgi:hypothetical protein
MPVEEKPIAWRSTLESSGAHVGRCLGVWSALVCLTRAELISLSLGDQPVNLILLPLGFFTILIMDLAAGYFVLKEVSITVYLVGCMAHGTHCAWPSWLDQI